MFVSSLADDVICVKMPVNHALVAYYYKRVGSEWVRYKREPVETLH